MLNGRDRVQRAKDRAGEIARLARARDNKALLRLDSDPETQELLGILDPRLAGPAEAHLRAARAWQARLDRKAQDKLEAASKALDELDLVLARGIIRKLDVEVLDEPTIARYDDLVLAIEARTMELDEIQSHLPEEPPSDEGRRFWRR